MSDRPSRRRPALMAAAAAAVTVGVAAAGWFATGSASAGTLSGTLYRDPTSQVVRWVAANPNDSRTTVIRDRVASQSQAHWLSAFNLGTVTSEVSALVNAANAVSQVPVLSVYEIPNRDCGGASAGGAADLNQYQQWISQFAPALGTRMVIIVLETDALALQTCLSASEVQARDQAIATAVQTIKAADPNAKVYLDGGHSAWNSASVQANRLAAAGVQFADGFFTDVANYQPLANEAAYGRSIISALAGLGVSGKHQIIDTSRNGGATGAAGDWCGDDNSDRRIGLYPTLATGDANIDGYVWVKPPGEADGCLFTPGSFVPDLAFSLASSAQNPSTAPTTSGPSPTPTTTPSARPSTSPSTAPPSSSPPSSSSPPPSTSPPPSSAPPAGGSCAASYQTTSSWQGGFQGQVTVTAGASAISNWTVTWTLAGGQSISQLWNGTLTVNGAGVTVRNLSWNGALAAGASAQFGFLASGSASAPTLSCS